MPNKHKERSAAVFDLGTLYDEAYGKYRRLL